MIEAPKSPDDRRPSPDALLELAKREGRGKLKVFLGMAPGVGKTYAMLAAARAQKADGIDVVVGIAETHGRSETAALMDGLEVLPLRAVAYRGRTLLEFDVNAAITRAPKLLLVDEFAHTNVPGLTHPKRYQDVEEVLRAGIDVWTTLNIQHLESLTDVVERIAGIRVQETVPDVVIEKADEIVIVDLPPEDLIQRLKDGKVYLPDNARRAIDQFFKPGNLIALRELALRHTADRVDEQMLAQLRQQGIDGPWPTAERLLVCVGSDTLSEAVIRTASRLAASQKADWIALHLKPLDREISDRATLRRAEKLMRLAERLGATTVRLAAKDLTAEILAFARRNNITQIVIGRSNGSFIHRLFGRNLSRDLVTRADGISVLVVAPPGGPDRKPWLVRPAMRPVVTGGIAAAIAVATAIVAGLGLQGLADLPNLVMVFLLAVLLCALRFGLWSAIAASLFSFLAYNFFFIEPRSSLTVAEPHELFSLLIFLIVAGVTGSLAGRLREQADTTRERAEATQALFDFSGKLSGAATLDDIIWLLASQTAATVKGRSIVLMDDGHGLAIKGGWPPEDQLGTTDWAAARWAFTKHELAGRGTDTLPTASFRFRPMLMASRVVAVVGVEPSRDEEPIPVSLDAALQAFVEQAAIAIERTMLVEDAAKAKTAAEGEKLRTALLSSISHDLRTPLASIVGSVTSLRMLGDRMSAIDRDDLLATIEEEAGRLSRFVSNLLDMTRLESGAIDIRRDWVDVGDTARGAVERAEKAFPARKHETSIDQDLPLIRGDTTLLQQVIFNLLDNAHKYSDSSSITRVEVTRTGSTMAVIVTDGGIGIPPEALEKVFEKFYRIVGADGRAPGTGLGLSICAGLIHAMGGSIKAESPVRSGRGTRMKITLPVEQAGSSPATIGMTE